MVDSQIRVVLVLQITCPSLVWVPVSFLGEFFNEFTNGASNNYDYTPAVNLNSMHSDMIAPRADELIRLKEH